MQQVNLLDKASDWGWSVATAVVLMVAGWIAKWKWKTDKDITDLRLHVAENYVKKSDMDALEKRIAGEFAEMKDELKQGNSLILDVLMERKIGTKRVGR